MIYIAGAILSLHLLIPHAHSEELSPREHDEIHQQHEGNFIDYLSYIFHEHSNEGDMEQFVPDQDVFDHTIDLGPVPQFVDQVPPIRLISSRNSYYVTPAIQNLQSGFISSWGNRPPPLH